MKSVKSATKIIVWISFFIIAFAVIGITDNSLGYKLPGDNFRLSLLPAFQHIQPSPENKCAQRIISNLTATRSTKDVTRIRKHVITHVAFLKVHKAASSTMQNLLFRFGIRHNLNILLPKRTHFLYKPEQKIPLKTGEHYDIFACHTVYRKQWFDSLLPPDSVNIAIVREPVSRMISAAYFYRDVARLVADVDYLKQIPRVNFIHNLVNFPGKYETRFFSHTRNTMGKDFGFQRGTNKFRIQRYLDQLNSQFILVLIMEKIDESLVMMKRLLNWSLIDIIYLKSNTNEYNSIVLNATEKAKFRSTSFLDFEIYEYFSRIFEMKLKQIGKDFYNEVSFFKTVLNQVTGFCLKKNKAKTKALSIQQSKWDGKFQITKSDCKLMQRKEVPFITKLRTKYLRSARKPIPRKSIKGPLIYSG